MFLNSFNIELILSITTHCIDKEFCRLDNVLATISLDQEHSGEEIARNIQEKIEEHGLKLSNIVACVRDDARNMAKSCRLLKIDRSY